MAYTPFIVTPAQAEPLSVADAKLHCRVDSSDDDTWFAATIVAAREYVERYTQRTLVATVKRITLDQFPCEQCGRYVLEDAPLSSVLSIKYDDADNVEQTLSTDDYRVVTNAEPSFLERAYGATWPTLRTQSGAVRVTYVAGYVHTTVALAISAGSQTVTPASMTGIVVGCALRVGSVTAGEWVTVTAVAATTFTAVFGSTHSAGATVSDVPLALVQAMLLLIGHWNENRAAVVAGTISTSLQLTVEALLLSYWSGVSR